VRRGLVGVLIVILTLGFPLKTGAAPARQPCCKRQVFLLLTREMSYELALTPVWPYLGEGTLGIGLVAAADDAELSGLEAYEALGAGGDKQGALHRALMRAGARTAAVGHIPLADAVRSALLGPEYVSEGEAAARSSELVILQSPLDMFSALPASPADEILFIASVPVRSPEMVSRRDEAPPVIVFRGNPKELNFREGFVCAPSAGCARGVTSDTTRRDGIVSNVDVAPTILDFLGLPIPEEMTGSPIRIEGEPPTRLHQRYLQYQRIHTPVGLLALAIALVTLLISVGVLLVWREAPKAAVSGLGILALACVALPVVMLPASLLPRLNYVVVLPTLAAGAALVTIVALWWGRGDPAAPVAIVAGLGLGVVILDGVLGWPAMMMPFLGDSALEGVRFYGMGNAFAGVYMAGAILLAARISPLAGVALLIAAGLLAGLPNFGAELGTSFTLFAAAGLWYMFRVRHRFGVREVAVAGAVALGGLAAVLLIHRFSPVPTHVTRVVEDATRSGVGEILAVFGRRLALNVRNTSAIPSNWLVVATLPVWLAVAWKRLGPFGSMLRRDPAWGDATVILALSSVIGFLVNDSMGVAGLAYTYLSAALVYPALRERWTSA
jgi:hypothetical protein